MAEQDQPRSTQRARFTVSPNAPITMDEAIDIELPAERGAVLKRIGTALKTYRATVVELVAGKYRSLNQIIPPHLTEACCAKAFVMHDGIIVRHEFKRTPEEKGFVGFTEDGDLATWAPPLSGNFVHCPLNAVAYDPGDKFVTVSITTQPVDRSAPESPLATQRMFALASRRASRLASPAKFAEPLLSLRNEFDMHLFGELDGETPEAAQPFILRSRVKLPLGWTAFEIFPPFDHDHWDPALASMRAERDLLAFAVQRSVLDAHFRSIDPRSEARKEAAQLLTQFEGMLNGPEEPLHQFVKSQPKLLLPTQVRAWSKLSLGGRDTDFVLRDAAGDYLLVELERPSHRLFGKKGKPLDAFQTAMDQITDWKRYLADNLRTAQHELGLTGISSDPRALVVIGRSADLSNDNRRKLIAMEAEKPKLKILTYDDLLANAKATFENVLGPLWDPGPNAEVIYPPRALRSAAL